MAVYSLDVRCRTNAVQVKVVLRLVKSPYVVQKRGNSSGVWLITTGDAHSDTEELITPGSSMLSTFLASPSRAVVPAR